VELGCRAFIGLLVASALVVIDHIASEESLMVEVNDVGGRQRMLSERIVHLLLEYAVEKDPVARSHTIGLIEKSLFPFDRTHKLLIRGKLSSGEQVIFEDNIDHLFFDEPEYLDERARLFVYNTREVLSKVWTPELLSSFYVKELRQASKQKLHSSLEKLASLYTSNSKARILHLRITVAFLLCGIILVVIAIGAFVFKPLFRHIVTQEEELHQLAYIDPLTNCHNRRSFLNSADIEFERSRRNALPFSVLFLDIDYLKTINDTFGHAMGDTAIQEIALICQKNLRDIDILGRIGGDEFGILLPDCSLDSARQTAERLRLSMSKHIIPGITGDMKLSFSIGAATLIDRDKNAFETINRADQNLYTAKRTGRNLIIAA
jgi:diguanylate cyclase (GGDEF)-like protein